MSRLQKLLNLLESGSSDATRKAAAKQISDVVKSHPAQLPSVLKKVHGYLYHKNWETRIAAGETIGYLAQAFPHASIDDLEAAHAAAGDTSTLDAPNNMDFQAFKLQQILDRGTPLLASGGQEYDIVEDPSLTPKQRLEKQKGQLKKRLGLDHLINTEDLFKDEDLEELELEKNNLGPGSQASGGPKQNATELLVSLDGLSARERNKLKRKAKTLNRTDSGKDSLGKIMPAGSLTSPKGSNIRRSSSGLGAVDSVNSTGGLSAATPPAPAPEDTGESDEEAWKEVLAGGWPLQRLCDQLVVDLLDPAWEVRHGAAVALREVLRLHAACAGVTAPFADETSGWCVPGGIGKRTLGPVTASELAAAKDSNRLWLEDAIVLLLCVLALDRFGDFGSDQVTAPVRETAAQALGVSLQPLGVKAAEAVLQHLRQLQGQPEWDVRYGGYLGLKYAMAGRPDLAPMLLQGALPALMAGLQDTDDDVRAASADALVPVAPALLGFGARVVTTVRALLWSLLDHLEELSPATSSVILLLARLYAPDAVLAAAGQGPPPAASDDVAAAAVDASMAAVLASVVGASSEELLVLVPRLWPFLRHSLSTVRMSAATCIERLLTASLDLGSEATQWVLPLLPVGLRLLFQVLLVEADERVAQAAQRGWNLLLQCCPPEIIAAAVSGPCAISAPEPTPLDQPPGASATGASAAASASAAGAAFTLTGPSSPPHLLGALIQLAATPTGKPLDSSLLISVLQGGGGTVMPWAAAAEAAHAADIASQVTSKTSSTKRQKGSAGGAVPSAPPPTPRTRTEVVVGAQGEGSATRMRLLTAVALGRLCYRIHSKDCGFAAQEMLNALSLSSAYSRSHAGLVIWYWMGEAMAALPPTNPAANVALPPEAGVPSTNPSTSVVSPPEASVPPTNPAAVVAIPPEDLPPSDVIHKLQAFLLAPSPCHPNMPNSAEPYVEAVPYYGQMRREAFALIGACMKDGLLLHTPGGIPVEQLTADQALALCTAVPANLGEGALSPAAKMGLQSAAGGLQTFEQYLHLNVLSASAAAITRIGQLPPKLNQIIQPLMNAVRKDPQPQSQEVCGAALAELLRLCCARTPSPNDKLLRNVCAMAWGDPAATPSAACPLGSLITPTSSIDPAAAAALESVASAASQLEERLNSHAMAGPRGSSGTAGALASVISAADDAASQAARISRLGAEATLRACAVLFGTTLWSQLPSLWDLSSKPVAALAAALGDAATNPTMATDLGLAQAAVNALQVLKIVGPSVVPQLVPSLADTLPLICTCSRHVNAAVRSAVASCLGALANSWLEELMPPLLRLLVPQLGSRDDSTRLGAVEVVVQLVSQLGSKLVAYAVLLVVPLLKRMSDSSAPVRSQATTCFGSLVALLPLAQGLPNPPGLDGEQEATVLRDTAFLLQLLDNRCVEDYVLPVMLPVSLRPYQQEGINWLAFLRRFGLHGVLADDMGLGKTLQATAIMSAVALECSQQYQSSGSSEDLPRPCLVLCPSTLVAHWSHEIHRWVGHVDIFKTLMYQGSPAARLETQATLAGLLKKMHAPPTAGTAPSPTPIVIMSYESVRADVEWVSSIQWLYCCCDEGHIIKSPKSKITQACKRVPAMHRLLLSGTPIQNNVLELWSLFDFLMPGFLGPERDFNARYGKALQAAKYSKKGSREAEAGLLAVEALHKQVMPFVLRRTKGQVLHDLPPKIIQDVYCEMSELQQRLYDDFMNTQGNNALEATIKGGADNAGAEAAVQSKGHVFQALQYMRRLCSHPAMVVDLKQPKHRQAMSEVCGTSDVRACEAALHQVAVAPKLVALRDILSQSGVISGVTGEEGDCPEEGCGSGHRLLVFAQMKAMLDLVEKDLLTPLGVSFLRIDGGVEPNSRFSIVQRFNSDPTIDVLLLTTAVGGLGLNLTSADTVVFLEHDWNPMKDLQAMDRAHRLGQTRTVNVYRLLMRDTLEERIMGLQKFKIEVANSVINQDNMSLKEMDTDKLLDLFSEEQAGKGKEGAKDGKAKSGLQAVLADMGELWDESQYDNEFSMKSFMDKVAPTPAPKE